MVICYMLICSPILAGPYYSFITGFGTVPISYWRRRCWGLARADILGHLAPIKVIDVKLSLPGTKENTKNRQQTETGGCLKTLNDHYGATIDRADCPTSLQTCTWPGVGIGFVPPIHACKFIQLFVLYLISGSRPQ